MMMGRWVADEACCSHLALTRSMGHSNLSTWKTTNLVTLGKLGNDSRDIRRTKQ